MGQYRILLQSDYCHCFRHTCGAQVPSFYYYTGGAAVIVGLVALTLTQYHEQQQLQKQREDKDHGEGAAAVSAALLNAGGPGSTSDSADYVELARGIAEPSVSRSQQVPSRPPR